MDELSTDETVPKLREMGINVIQPPDIVGVTYNWNLARASAEPSPSLRNKPGLLSLNTHLGCAEDDATVACGANDGMSMLAAFVTPLDRGLLCIACD